MDPNTTKNTKTISASKMTWIAWVMNSMRNRLRRCSGGSRMPPPRRQVGLVEDLAGGRGDRRAGQVSASRSPSTSAPTRSISSRTALRGRRPREREDPDAGPQQRSASIADATCQTSVLMNRKVMNKTGRAAPGSPAAPEVAVLPGVRDAQRPIRATRKTLTNLGARPQPLPRGGPSAALHDPRQPSDHAGHDRQAGDQASPGQTSRGASARWIASCPDSTKYGRPLSSNQSRTWRRRSRSARPHPLIPRPDRADMTRGPHPVMPPARAMWPRHNDANDSAADSAQSGRIRP